MVNEGQRVSREVNGGQGSSRGVKRCGQGGQCGLEGSRLALE